jgi:hypothetical protein
MVEASPEGLVLRVGGRRFPVRVEGKCVGGDAADRDLGAVDECVPSWVPALARLNVVGALASTSATMSGASPGESWRNARTTLPCGGSPASPEPW